MERIKTGALLRCCASNPQSAADTSCLTMLVDYCANSWQQSCLCILEVAWHHATQKEAVNDRCGIKISVTFE
jgi:hypothetical protein